MRSLLLDSVTHEFRTPLTAIKASVTSLLGSPTLAAAEKEELLTVINEESDRLNRLVGEAAEMAQLDAGKVELQLEPTRIREVVDEAMEELKQVLVHLLENAAKYSAPNTLIRITAEIKGGILTTSIADRGPGIDDFEQALVFEKFYRGRNQRVQVHGTGMGLAICKAIVEAHGGRLGVTSQLGHGSVFYFSLPLG